MTDSARTRFERSDGRVLSDHEVDSLRIVYWPARLTDLRQETHRSIQDLIATVQSLRAGQDGMRWEEGCYVARVNGNIVASGSDRQVIEVAYNHHAMEARESHQVNGES